MKTLILILLSLIFFSCDFKIDPFFGPENRPPNKPSNPTPSDNSTSVSVDANLHWECSDPECDPLTYIVYFGTSSDPPMISFGNNHTGFNLGTLDYETTYYWKISARSIGGKTVGDIWEFETISPSPF